MGLYPDDNVDLDYFTENVASGGSKGDDFTHLKHVDGAVMTKIEAWKDGRRIRAVKSHFSDGSVYTVGTTSGSHRSFSFSTGEYITRLNLQPSGEQDRLGAIWFKTNKGGEFGIFSDWLKPNTQHWVDVGSGICCGVFGGAKKDVDRFGMAMLRNVTSATMDDVEYPNLDLQVVAQRPDILQIQEFENNTSVEQSQTFSFSSKVTIREMWSTTQELGFSMSVSVYAGIPEVGGASEELSWTVSSSSTHEIEREEEKTMKWTFPMVVPPHTTVKATGEVFSDVINIPFTGTMNLKLENGKTCSYQVEGIYDGARYARSNMLMEEIRSSA